MNEYDNKNTKIIHELFFIKGGIRQNPSRSRIKVNIVNYIIKNIMRMVYLLFWAGSFAKTLSFVFLNLFNTTPTSKKIYAATFFTFFATQVLFSALAASALIAIADLDQDPFPLAQFIMSLNSLILAVWMTVYYGCFWKKNIMKSSAISYFLLAVIWGSLIITATFGIQNQTDEAMKTTSRIVGCYAILMGVGKFVPQIKLHWKNKSSEGLPYTFIISEMAAFLFLGVFSIVTATEPLQIIIGVIGAVFGVAGPITLIAQKKIYKQEEKLKKETMAENLISQTVGEWKKGPASTTIYSSDALSIE